MCSQVLTSYFRATRVSPSGLGLCCLPPPRPSGTVGGCCACAAPAPLGGRSQVLAPTRRAGSPFALLFVSARGCAHKLRRASQTAQNPCSPEMFSKKAKCSGGAHALCQSAFTVPRPNTKHSGAFALGRGASPTRCARVRTILLTLKRFARGACRPYPAQNCLPRF